MFRITQRHFLRVRDASGVPCSCCSRSQNRPTLDCESVVSSVRSQDGSGLRFAASSQVHLHPKHESWMSGSGFTILPVQYISRNRAPGRTECAKAAGKKVRSRPFLRHKPSLLVRAAPILPTNAIYRWYIALLLRHNTVPQRKRQRARRGRVSTTLAETSSLWFCSSVLSGGSTENGPEASDHAISWTVRQMSISR